MQKVLEQASSVQNWICTYEATNSIERPKNGSRLMKSIDTKKIRESLDLSALKTRSIMSPRLKTLDFRDLPA